jgi:hypothetical protein
MAAIQQRARAGETVYQLARDTGLSTRTIRVILAQPDLPIAPKAEQPVEPPVSAPIYDYNIEEPPHPAIRDPRHVNGMAERVGGVTINPLLPQPQPVFRTTFRQWTQGTPERTPTTRSSSSDFDLFTGRPL